MKRRILLLSTNMTVAYYFNLQTKKLCYGMAYIVDYYYCDYR